MSTRTSIRSLVAFVTGLLIAAAGMVAFAAPASADPLPAPDAPWVSTTLADAVYGHNYSGHVEGPAGDTYTYAQTGGSLPGGIDLHPDGTITGSSGSNAATFTAEITATDPNDNHWVADVSLTLGASKPWVQGTVPDAVLGVPYSAQVIGPDYGTSYVYSYRIIDMGMGDPDAPAPTWLSVDSSGHLSGTPDDPSDVMVEVRVVDPDGNQFGIGITIPVTVPTPVWTTTAISGLHPGVQSTASVSATGFDLDYGVVGGSLPNGLTLSADGTITGSPLALGPYDVTIRANHYGVSSDREFSGAVTDPLPANSPWVNDTLPNAIVGSPYSVRLAGPNSGLSYTYSFQLIDYDHSQPNASRIRWLVYGTDGTISGTPNLSSTATVIEVRATDSDGDVYVKLVGLEVTGVVPVWSTSTLPSLYPGIPVSASVSASGSGVSYSVVSGALPAGLSLDANGAITGSPIFTGPYDVTIRADNDGGVSDQEFTGSVLPPSAALTLNFGVGDSDLTLGAGAAGLASGSGWSLELHSTPTVIGSGLVAGDGTFFSTIRIPAGTAAGAHELVLSGVSPSGVAVTANVWFTLGRNGTILAISFTGPTPGLAVLAATGAPDESGAIFVGMLALLTGAALLLVRRGGRTRRDLTDKLLASEVSTSSTRSIGGATYT